jgi:hypothetical protein
VIRQLATGLTGAWLLSCGVAHADLGNPGVGGSTAPGLCEYPAVCGSGVDGAIGAGFYYWEDFPTESNGAHRHCQWGGGAFEGNVNVGFSMMFTASAGAEGPVGALNGACYYVCPDMQKAAMPNPPGAWRDAIIPTKCQPIDRNPFLPPDAPLPAPVDVPIAPPIGGQGAVPAIPFGQPQPQPGAAVQPPSPGAPGGTEPPLAEQLPSQTLPVCGNPDATTTEGCR